MEYLSLLPKASMEMTVTLFLLSASLHELTAAGMAPNSHKPSKPIAENVLDNCIFCTYG